MGNLIGRAAALADLSIPLAATSAGRGDSGREDPFSAAVLSAAERLTSGPVPADESLTQTRRRAGM